MDMNSILLCGPKDLRSRCQHICHKGHSHQSEEEVSTCNRQERKLIEARPKHDNEQEKKKALMAARARLTAAREKHDNEQEKKAYMAAKAGLIAARAKHDNEQEKKKARQHICHKGHTHHSDEEVKECHKQERKLQEMKAKKEVVYEKVDRDGAVHRQKIVIQGDPTLFYDKMKYPEMLAVEGKKGQKAKKH